MNFHLDPNGNPIIDQQSEDGFVDLTFRIVGVTADATHYRFHLAASHNNNELGLDVAMVKGIESGFDSNMDLIKGHVYREGVRFIRSGTESDRLVSTIGWFYQAEAYSRRMVPEETFTVIALHQGDLDFECQAVKLKLFGHDSDPFVEDEYYESFFHVDLANRVVHWNEKDPDYRQPLLGALTAE